MTDAREPQQLIDAAEQAAKSGDYATAERLLRDAADLQESGPPAQRAELANTLNNLGVVCELTDNPVEAERCFRRAYQIAVEVLEPGHPFVTTARKNLEDFCAANGKDPFPDGEPQSRRKAVAPPPSSADLVTAPPLTDLLRDLLPEPAPEPVPQAPPRPLPAPPRQAAPSPTPPAELTPSTSSRGLAIGLIAVAALFALFLARSLFFREPATRDIPQTANTEGAQTPAPAPSPSASAPQPAPAPPAKAPAPIAEATPQKPKPKDVAANKSTKAAAPTPATGSQSGVSLVSGQLCRNLRTGGGEWRCEKPGDSVRAGQVFFYTRVKSPRDVVVQHRWYRGNELRKSVDLEVAANPGTGYRTYSRNTVSAGEWRVEVRTKNGDVLQQETFSVR